LGSILLGKHLYHFIPDKNSCVKDEHGNNVFTLPPYIRSDNSILQKINVVFNSSVSLGILKYIEVGLVIILFLIIILKSWTINLYIKRKFHLLENLLLKKKFPVEKIKKRGKIIIVSILIALSIFYGVLWIVLCISGTITAILFIILIGLTVWIIFKHLPILIYAKQKDKNRVKVGLIFFTAIWMGFEVFLRIAGINATFNEKNGGYYTSGYHYSHWSRNENNSGLLINKEYSNDIKAHKEFAYEIKCNKEGLRDVDHNYTKNDSEYRIICLGNSFTEGIGAPQDSTWPAFLERKLKAKINRQITVFNAGKASSDPFFEFMLFKEKLLQYSPDLLLLTLGSSDFNFYFCRGGFERFTPQGYEYRKAPHWERLYAVSFVFRYFMNNMLHYKNLISPDKYTSDVAKANNDIEDCIYRFHQLSNEIPFKMAVVFYDDQSSAYNQLKKSLLEKGEIITFDLFKYNREVKKLSKDEMKKYYWPIDGHCNSKGYNLLAEGVEWYLIQAGILDSVK